MYILMHIFTFHIHMLHIPKKSTNSANDTAYTDIYCIYIYIPIRLQDQSTCFRESPSKRRGEVHGFEHRVRSDSLSPKAFRKKNISHVIRCIHLGLDHIGFRNWRWW